MACDVTKIIKGEDRTFFVRVNDECTGDPFDFTGATAIKAIFKSQIAGTNVEITLADAEIVVIAPATIGKLQLTISDIKTALMLASAKIQTFELEIDVGTTKRIVKIIDQLSVEARI